MGTDLKTAILEIVDIAKAVPEPFQVRCFEILLNDLLASQQRNPTKRGEKTGAEIDHLSDPAPSALDGKPPAQADIQVADLHVKAKKFLEKHDLSTADLNEVLFKEGEEFKPLFDDLKTTKLAESQIR